MTIDEAISHEERNVEINKLIGEVSDCEPTNAIAYHRQLVEWINELKQLREQTRWIPVSERLPDTNDDVLVYDGADMYVAWYARKRMWQGWNSHDNSFERDTPIIAWMPLPEPYQAESEE